MNPRSEIQPRTRRNTKHITRTTEVRKRKGRAGSTSEFGGNELKRTCIKNSMEIEVPSRIIEECSLQELSLEANELLDSPINKNIEQLKRKQTLRSYNNKINQTCHLELLNPRRNLSNCFLSIDKCKSPLPELVWANPDDVWQAMHLREKEHKRDPNYLKKHPALQVRMRSILLDWLIEVCEVYRLHRETFHLAADFVDRYLATQNKIAKQRLQLIGVTSLFIAAKIEEIYPPKLTEFAYVTDGACTCDEITKQELLILQALGWKLSPVTANSWLMMYLQINQHDNNYKNKSSNDITRRFEFPDLKQPLQLARFSQLIDLCLLDVGSLKFPYSIIASSCIHHILPKVDITGMTGHSWNELCECIQWLTPFAQISKQQKLCQVKQFEKVPPEDAQNIQVHNSGLSLLDQVHEITKKSKEGNLSRTSPVQCGGILTPPNSTKKEY